PPPHLPSPVPGVAFLRPERGVRRNVRYERIAESPNIWTSPSVTMSTSPPGDRGPRGPRKVRTPQGRMPANSRAGRPDGKCHREQTADGPTHDGHRQG